MIFLHLCYRPAAFFRHICLLSFHSEKEKFGTFENDVILIYFTFWKFRNFEIA
jgi:hypothetical protein